MMPEVEVEVAEAGFYISGLEEVHKRVAPRFARAEARARSLRYLEALVGQVERKNCWQVAEAAGENTPDGMQRLLRKARWDADEVRDDLRGYVVEYLGDPEGVMVVDETGFLKKGDKSVGVQRQYSGTAGKIENCQIGVFLAYASPQGRAFLDRELYLPREWAEDRARRQEAGVPEDVAFAKKSELARRMLERALEAGVPCRWVVADEVYGNDRGLRRWLEGRRQSYVVAVASNQYVWWYGLEQRRVGRLAAEIAEGAWERLSVGDGAKGPRVYDWAGVRLPSLGPVLPPGWGRWLLVRRSIEKPDEVAYFLAASPEEAVSLVKLAEVAGKRWAVEIAFEEAKGEAGLDEYEVRRWEGWYRHITLSLLAHAYLAVSRLRAGDKKGEPRS